MGADIHGVFQKYDSGKWLDIPHKYTQDRHYQLFAVLAGVRNGFGFAGVVTGEPVKPISEPRGFPEDFDGENHETAFENFDIRRQEYYDRGELFWMGDHSFSWLTGEEMLAWRGPKVVKVGVLSRSEYNIWDGKSRPNSYCGDVSGGLVIKIDDNDQSKLDHPNWTHIHCSWDTDLNDELSYFFDEVRRLVELHGKIRFVFGFDS